MRKIFSRFLICTLVGILALAFVPVPVAAMTGSGTEGDPYIIYDVTDLQNMQNDLDAYYELANDIDASATAGWNWNAGRGVYEGFVPISGFIGQLDGNFYAISNLYMNWLQTYTAVGLFRSLGDDAVIENLLVLDADVTNIYTSQSSSGCAAVLIGQIYDANNWVIRGCVVSGNVTNRFTDDGGAGHIHGSAGGLVGYVIYKSGGIIERCASYANVVCYGYDEAHAQGGGFVGDFQGSHTIRDCYSRGDVVVTADYLTRSGGFAGYQLTSTIDNCYSTGSAEEGFLFSGTCTDCFWDTETSATITSDCGIGKSTIEMKTQSTFTDAGWDFDTIWTMGGAVNGGYPYLLWWYDPYEYPGDFTQVLWFQPNTIIEGTTLPDRMGNEDGIITWGANPPGINITHGRLIPEEEEYIFEPVTPSSQDIIKPEPETMIGDVDLERLHDNPLYPLVQILSIDGFLNERLVWLGLAWFFVIVAMLGVHLGFDTRPNSEKPQHFVLTTITGLGLSILFYTMGIFPLWVIILMAFGLGGSIIWERQPVI